MLMDGSCMVPFALSDTVKDKRKRLDHPSKFEALEI